MIAEPHRFIENLPHINFGISMVSSAFLIAGLFAMRAKKISLHKKMMTTAVATMALFLTGYVTRLCFMGFTRFHGPDDLKIAYYLVHIVHMLVALPSLLYFIPVATWYAAKGKIAEHKRLAKTTAVLWLATSALSVPVYLMLFTNLLG